MGSARTSPVEDTLTAVVTTLKAASALTALATGGVYNNVPQGTSYPYLEVTCPTDRRQDTFGTFGADILVDTKAVSQSPGDQEALRIIDATITALNNAALSLSSHRSLGVAWESSDRFRDVVDGIVTRQHVATFRIWAEQTS